MKGITALLRVTHPDRDGWLRLAGRRIYILPTAYGLVFGMLLMLLLIASLNYANNPAFLLTFLLTGIFFQGIFYTWRNLKGVELRWLGAEPVFAGQTARLHFQLRCPDHDRHALVLSLDGNHPVVTDCRAGSTVTLTLPYPVQRRGRHQPTRLLLESRYPLGLLRAWARLEPQGEFLVWPRPLPHDPPAAEGGRSGHLDGTETSGGGDFHGPRNYQPGDHPGQILWKALAAEKGLLVKQFASGREARRWLDFDALDDPDPEHRLARLAGAVERLHATATAYGLRLPGQVIEPGRGEAHRRRCLDALALHEAPPP